MEMVVMMGKQTGRHRHSNLLPKEMFIHPNENVVNQYLGSDVNKWHIDNREH